MRLVGIVSCWECHSSRCSGLRAIALSAVLGLGSSVSHFAYWQRMEIAIQPVVTATAHDLGNVALVLEELSAAEGRVP